MADGTLKVGTITTSSGSGTITLGQSGETVVFGSGVTTKYNQPAFAAYLSSNQSLSDNTDVKLQIDTEVFDTDNCYDNSTNYRFTPTVSGKYCFYLNVATAAGDDNNASTTCSIFKNGSKVAQLQQHTHISAEAAVISAGNSIILEANGSTDYFEFYGLCNFLSGSANALGDSFARTYVGGYRIGA
tara:strand:+ start:197 stop:754 length:558 start_codon:yes stop_codon:yes gene_type:complete